VRVQDPPASAEEGRAGETGFLNSHADRSNTMDAMFNLRRGALHVEDMPLQAVAERFGTPTYVYSRAALAGAYRAFESAFADALARVPSRMAGSPAPLVCYAVKANPNLAILNLFAQHQDEMDALGVHHGTLIAAVGGSGTVIEPCLYWPDASNPFIDDMIEDAHLAKLPNLPHNPAAWALVQKLKQKIVDLFFEQGAIHFQIGRTYRYQDGLDPRAMKLLKAVKDHLDPQSKMNPGSLGL
jgi:hypothetical protein